MTPPMTPPMPGNIVWLASYPKSGNTWVRALLGNYFHGGKTPLSIDDLAKITGGDTRRELYDRAAGRPFRAQDFDECIALRPKVQRLIAAQARGGRRLVKTHSRIERIGPIDLILPEVTAGAVYILRNPFDIAPSFAGHTGQGIDAAIANMTNPRMVFGRENGIMEVLGSWDGHVESWLTAPGLSRHAIRYEDLVRDTETAMRGLLRFLQTPVRDGQLRRAIRHSRFDELRRQEKAGGFRERPKTASARFFRKGRPGTWRAELTPAQAAKLRAAFLPALEKHYPELLAETEEFAKSA